MDVLVLFKGYGGFPGTVCASVNDTIIHGFPDNVPLKDGDIVSIDVGSMFLRDIMEMLAGHLRLEKWIQKQSA